MAVGKDPDEFLIEHQLTNWATVHGFALTEEQKSVLRALSEQAPSRYELAEFLEPYDIACRNVVTMQEMSHDRQRYGPVELVVATDPGSWGDPSVHTFDDVTGSGLDAQDAPRPDRYTVIWVPLGTMKRLGGAAEVVAERLSQRWGGLPLLVAALAEGLHWSLVLDVLRGPRWRVPPNAQPLTRGDWRLPVIIPFGSQTPGGNHLERRLLEIAALTFTLGHEAGHIYLTQTGEMPVPEILRPSLAAVDDWTEEPRADAVGIGAVWDGVHANQGVSIDVSWMGPIMGLAYHAGRDASFPPGDRQAQYATALWLHRLENTLRFLGTWLRGNEFETARVQQILTATVPFATAMYEYGRTWEDLGSSRETAGPPAEYVFSLLQTITHQELSHLR